MNRKLFAVASAAALLLTGCGSAATPASAPDVTPIAASSEAASSSAPTSAPSSSAPASSEASSSATPEMSDRGYWVKKVGQTAGLTDTDGSRLVSFAVTDIKMKLKCNSGQALKPDNGHLIAVKMDVDVKKAFADPDYPGATFPTSASSWKFVSKNGTTFNGDLGTDASINCLDDKDTLPFEGIGPAQKAIGLIVLDVPATTGTLIFDYDGTGGWEWELKGEPNA